MNSKDIFYKGYRLIGKQQWRRLGLRWRLFSYVTGGYEFVTNFDGYRYRGNTSNYIDRNIFFFGAYEREELEYLRRFLTKEASVLDIGANVGQHALYFSRYAGLVCAFDPHKPSIEQLKAKIADNAIRNIHVFPVALGERDEGKTFYMPPGGESGEMASFVSGHTSQNSKAEEVQIYKGDSFLARQGIRNVRLIKLDVEGFEKEVLAGLNETIVRDRPIIFMEYLQETREKFGSNEAFRANFPADYQIYRLQCNRKRFFFFNEPRCKLVPFTRGFADGFHRNIVLIPR